jgi:hypothetical protein
MSANYSKLWIGSIKIKSSRVVCSAGTINSPILLKRSGLKNANIGSNLRLHPVFWQSLEFFDRVINTFRTHYVCCIQNCQISSSKVGCLVEVPAYYPALANEVGGNSSKIICSIFFNINTTLAFVGAVSWLQLSRKGFLLMVMKTEPQDNVNLSKHDSRNHYPSWDGKRFVLVRLAAL